MSGNAIRVEVRPVDYEPGAPQLELPLADREHWVRLRNGANRTTEWATEPLSNRANARRAANRHAAAYGVPVWEFLPDGTRIR